MFNAMKYYIITYGCQMNYSDSERIAAILEKSGYSAALNKESADLIIINACSVRQSAVNRIYGQIKNVVARNKRRDQKTKIILTGCLLNRDKRKLESKVDLILDIKNLPYLSQYFSKKKTPKKGGNYLNIKPKCQNYYSAYVPIMTGCNNFCSYCVVPYVRGREYSRPLKEIVNEVKNLIKKGFKEIILLGQNVNSYKNSDIDFPKLFKIINDLKGNFWLNFITSHPKDLSDKLIKTMAECKKFSPYLHLPIQSGDDQILKKMNRGYDTNHYKNLIKKIRIKIPRIAISTDIIAGFPAETKKQFNNTAKIMEKIKFDMAYISMYSPRGQTAAYKLKDDIPLIEKKKRWQILNELLKKTALANNKKLLNKTVDVLAEKENYGHTDTFKQIRFDGNEKLIGKFVKIKVIGITPWNLKGKLVN